MTAAPKHRKISSNELSSLIANGLVALGRITEMQAASGLPSMESFGNTPIR